MRDGKFCDSGDSLGRWFTAPVGQVDPKSGQYGPIVRCAKHKPKEVCYWNGRPRTETAIPHTVEAKRIAWWGGEEAPDSSETVDHGERANDEEGSLSGSDS